MLPELRLSRLPRRVVSREVLARRLARIAIQLVRYGEGRARTPADHGWCVRVGDPLREAVEQAARTT